MKPYIPKIVGNVIFVVLQIVFQTFFVMSEMKKIIDLGVTSGNMQYIWASDLRMLLFTAASGLCTVAASYFSACVTAGATTSIRNACFKKVESMSVQDYDKFGGSTLTTRTVTDVTQIQIFLINMLRSSLMVPVIIICMLILIFRINVILFGVLLTAFVLTVIFLVRIGRSSQGFFEALQEKVDRISQMMKEKLTGVRAIRAFGNQKLEEQKMARANEEAYEQAITANEKISM